MPKAIRKSVAALCARLPWLCLCLSTLPCPVAERHPISGLDKCSARLPAVTTTQPLPGVVCTGTMLLQTAASRTTLQLGQGPVARTKPAVAPANTSLLSPFETSLESKVSVVRELKQPDVSFVSMVHKTRALSFSIFCLSCAVFCCMLCTILGTMRVGHGDESGQKLLEVPTHINPGSRANVPTHQAYTRPRNEIDAHLLSYSTRAGQHRDSAYGRPLVQQGMFTPEVGTQSALVPQVPRLNLPPQPMASQPLPRSSFAQTPGTSISGRSSVAAHSLPGAFLPYSKEVEHRGPIAALSSGFSPRSGAVVRPPVLNETLPGLGGPKLSLGSHTWPLGSHTSAVSMPSCSPDVSPRQTMDCQQPASLRHSGVVEHRRSVTFSVDPPTTTIQTARPSISNTVGPAPATNIQTARPVPVATPRPPEHVQGQVSPCRQLQQVAVPTSQKGIQQQETFLSKSASQQGLKGVSGLVQFFNLATPRPDGGLTHRSEAPA